MEEQITTKGRIVNYLEERFTDKDLEQLVIRTKRLIQCAPPFKEGF